MTTFAAQFLDSWGEPISTVEYHGPLPQAETRALDHIGNVEMNCRRRVYTVEMLHDGQLCSTLAYRQ